MYNIILGIVILGIGAVWVGAACWYIRQDIEFMYVKDNMSTINKQLTTIKVSRTVEQVSEPFWFESVDHPTKRSISISSSHMRRTLRQILVTNTLSEYNIKLYTPTELTEFHERNIISKL